MTNKAQSEETRALVAEIAARDGVIPGYPLDDNRPYIREIARRAGVTISLARWLWARYMRGDTPGAWGGAGRGQGLKPGQAPEVAKMKRKKKVPV